MNRRGAEDWFNIYYSQNMEELIIKSFFPHLMKGFYISVNSMADNLFRSYTKYLEILINEYEKLRKLV